MYQRLAGVVGDDVSIGDEIEAEGTEQWGTVVGVIRNKFGNAVCYKVRCVDCFDYIPKGAVTLHEKCGSAQWSLGRIGYVLMDDGDGENAECYYNEATGDVIRW